MNISLICIISDNEQGIFKLLKRINAKKNQRGFMTQNNIKIIILPYEKRHLNNLSFVGHNVMMIVDKNYNIFDFYGIITEFESFFRYDDIKLINF